MQRKFASFATSLITLATMLSLPAASWADTFNRAASNGHYRLDGVNGTVVNVNAFKVHYDATDQTSVWGTVSVINNTFFASSRVADETYSRVTIDGVDYKHAEITSRSFPYYDFIGGKIYTAHLVIDLTQRDQHGTGGFQLINDDDGSIITQSEVNGAYAEAPFLIGHVAITE